MQEDAAKPKLTVPLPAGALAWKFGGPGSAASGFTSVAPDTVFPGAARCGFVDPKKLKAGGEGWPDGLSGTFVLPPRDGRMEFRPRPRRRVFRLALRRPRHPQGIRGSSLPPSRRRRDALRQPAGPVPVLQPQVPLPLPRHALFREAPCFVDELHRPDVPGPHDAREGRGRRVHAGGRELLRQRRGAGPRVGEGRFRQVRRHGPPAAHRGVREDAAAAPRQEAAAAGRRWAVPRLRTGLRRAGQAVDGADGRGARTHLAESGGGAARRRRCAWPSFPSRTLESVLWRRRR